MDRKIALIVIASLSGCTTTHERLSTAKAIEAVAKQEPAKPALPASCTAIMDRVKPRPDEPWVLTDKRWNIVAYNRDQQAIDCAAEWSSYWDAYKASTNQ